jgi:hypothetical protein
VDIVIQKASAFIGEDKAKQIRVKEWTPGLLRAMQFLA